MMSVSLLAAACAGLATPQTAESDPHHRSSLTAAGGDQITRQVLHNPYQDIDWDEVERHRTCLHIHTQESDGRFTPDETVQKYVDAGYTILSITDHDTMGSPQTTWPWSDYDIAASHPEVLGIEGNEISNPHHMGSYFNDYGDPDQDSETAALTEINERDGLAVMFHPGRYSRSVEWYVDLYQRFDHLVGMEVYNQGDRYPRDRELYDDVLAEMMPSRPVWAFSNDDFHQEDHFGQAFTIFLLSEDDFNEDGFRQAMTEGHFFAVYDPSRDASGMRLPEAVQVSESAIRLEMDAPEEAISWVSHGRTVHRGKRLPLDTNLGNYVRPVVDGKNGAKTLLQPFALSGGEAMTTSSLIVEHGEGSGDHIAGAMDVPIRAGEAPEDKVFDRWVSEDMSRIENPHSAETSVSIKDADEVRVSASFRPPRPYDLTVENGTGGAEVLEESRHLIEASVPEGMAFDYWSGDTDVLDTIWSPQAEVTMPAKATTLRAHFTEPFSTPEQLTNPAFSDGLNGWDADPEAVTIETRDDGTRFLRISEITGVRRMIKDVEAAPGDRITLLFDARLDRDDVGAPMGFIVEKHDGSRAGGSPSLRVRGSEWRTYALSTEATTSRDFERIQLDLWIWVPTGRELDVDNFRLRIHSP